MTELLPCPFCGAEIQVSNAGWGFHPRPTDCYLKIEVVAPGRHDAWNRRPSPVDGAAVMGGG